MPRKRNGWGNPESLRFPTLGYSSGRKTSRLSGQYPENNYFGSTITRSVTEHYDLNSDWKAWRRGYDIYSHGKFVQSDYSLKFKQYAGTTDEVTVYLRFYEYPASNSDTGTRVVTIRYTDIANYSYPADSGRGQAAEYRTGLTNVFKVKNDVSDYASESEYFKQKASGEIPIVLNRYDNNAISQVRRAQAGSRLTDGYYSGNLIELEDADGLPIRMYGRTYSNLKLEGNDQATRDLEEELNTASYEYKLNKRDFIRLIQPTRPETVYTTAEALAWTDDTGVFENLIGKIIVPNSFWNDFQITVAADASGRKATEKRFGEIYNLDLNVNLYRYFTIYDLTEFPNTVYKASDFKVLFQSLSTVEESGGTEVKNPVLPIDNAEDPEDGSARLEIESNYIFINSEYYRFYGRNPTSDDLDKIYRQVTTASLTIEEANILEIVDHRQDSGFNSASDTDAWITLRCVPSKQEIQLYRPFDSTNNTVVGIFDATSFSYKAWANGQSFYQSYTSDQFKRSLNPSQVDERGYIELQVDPWSYKCKDMWKLDTGYQPLIYDLLFSCSCPAYSHSLTKAPESQGPDRQGSANRQVKYPLPGALSRALTTDNDEDSVAGNAITWNDGKYTTSHKNCKHTIACMYEFGLDVREPNSVPTEKARVKFLENLYDEREKQGYMDIEPSSVQRSEISNFDVGLSMLESVKIPSTSTAAILKTPSSQAETVVIPITSEEVEQAVQEAEEAPLTDPESTHNNWANYGNTKKLVGFSKPLPNGASEWDFETSGDFELENQIADADYSFGSSEDIYTFRALDAVVLDFELYGAGGASSADTYDRYWPYDPSVTSDHNENNEEQTYITNNTYAEIDASATEDSTYTSAATPADTNYYEGYGGIAKGRISLAANDELTLTLGMRGNRTGGVNTYGGEICEIKVNGTKMLVAGGGGGSSLETVIVNDVTTRTFRAPGGHGGFGSSPNGTDGVVGFRQSGGGNRVVLPAGKGSTQSADGALPDVSSGEAQDLAQTSLINPWTPVGELLSAGFVSGGGGRGYSLNDGSSGAVNNHSTDSELRGAAGGGGGSSYFNAAIVTNGSYEGTPLPPNTDAKIIIKLVPD